MCNRKLFLSISLICLGLLQVSCESDRNKRGREYFPDMARSEAFETYAPNPFFPDGKTAQLPAKGTIPRHMIPFQYSKSLDDKKLAGAELQNPYEANEENLARGKTEFDIFCSLCHGLDGRGAGSLYASGKYPLEAPTLLSEKMQNAPDGEIYHSISLGSGVMGPFASLLRPEDRWKIILYIKNGLSINNNSQTQ